MQPFGFNLSSGNKFLNAATFGLITTCCYIVFSLGISKPVTRRVSPWRIWHQACLVMGLILFIAICNFVMFSFIYNYPITFPFFLMFLYWTVIIGFFMTALSIGIEYTRFLRDRMETLLSNTTEKQKDIEITIHDTNVRGNDLCIPINSLLYIEAQKNNVSVCYIKDNNPVRIEIHTTLSAVIDEMKDYENIFQCHRSFVVNVNNITSAHGNSNGYQIMLGTCSSPIPVSRSYVPAFRNFIS